MNSPAIPWGAGTRKKEAPVNVPNPSKGSMDIKTDAQMMADFRTSIWRTGNGALGMNDMRDFNEYKMNQMKWTPVQQMDKNGNGSINTVQKWARVSSYGRGNTATGPWASNFSGIEK
jgi:hypothetical protein